MGDSEAGALSQDPRRYHEIALRINGALHRIRVLSNWTLNDVLRNRLDLTGTKRACDYGGCGSCTVLMDGVDVYSCSILAVEAEGKEIVTIEGTGGGGSLPVLQSTFARSYAAQCGWCTPGMIMSAKALLDRNSDPTAEEVRMALSGVLCRCTGYSSIVQAVLETARILKGGKDESFFGRRRRGSAGLREGKGGWSRQVPCRYRFTEHALDEDS